VGSSNTATGIDALISNNTGSGNTAVGASALQSNANGAGNTASGSQALQNNTSGQFNTADGDGALLSNTMGQGNTAIGASALQNGTTGSNNIVVGAGAGFGIHTANSVIAIGATGADVSGSCYIANIFNATSANGIPVLVNSNDKLGTSTSSARFKENIRPMNTASDALYQLKPVTFRYKKEIDPASMSQFGLVAEDVEKVNPDLIVRDKEGKPYSVRYDQVNAMLLNEFLKERKAFVNEQRKVQELEKRVERLAADLEKVTTQIQLTNAAAQIAANQK
jgi:hypothetical protein